jgi:hypothetical protein
MKKVLIYCLFSSVLIFSCDKSEIKTQNSETTNQIQVKNSDAGRTVGKITDKNIENLHSTVTEFSLILKDIYKNEIVFKEVNNLIFQGYYSDENILLDDLIKPERSKLVANARISTNSFKSSFYEILAEKQTSTKNARLNENKFDEYLISNGVSIYFPYSENFKGKNRKDITIVMPPKEDVNEAVGIKLTKCGKDVCEEKVVVNDLYAMNNPTHIIYAGGAKVKDNYVKELKKSKVAAISQVYVGAVKCRKQYDALISFTGNGGGSEIKFFRGSGYLASGTTNQVTSPTGDIISSDFSRGQINNCTFQVINGSWDTDWKVDNLEQVFGVYEEDTQGSKTFTGSINTTIKAGGVNQNGTLGYSITIQTQDEIIRNWKISRSAFYVANGINQGYGLFNAVGGLSGGPWAAWDGAVSVGDCTGANVAYVLPTITN